MGEAKTSKEMFGIINGLLHGTKERILPLKSDERSLPDTFLDFFRQKIQVIRDGIRSSSCTASSFPTHTTDIGANLARFAPATTTEVFKLIGVSASKTCRLDPVPTWVVKGCAGILSPVITTIVNESLQCGTVPIILKESIVTPVIKRDNLEREDLHNYRPISNIPFVAKLLEKVVATRLLDHCLEQDLLDETQLIKSATVPKRLWYRCRTTYCLR